MRAGTFSTTYYRGLWLGIYEEFIRFLEMLNYDTNIEIKFIEFNPMQVVFVYSEWFGWDLGPFNSFTASFISPTFHRPYISKFSGRHGPVSPDGCGNSCPTTINYRI